MRNLLVLGAVALVVFGVSGALSYILQNSKQSSAGTNAAEANSGQTNSQQNDVVPDPLFPQQHSEEAEKWERVRHTLELKKKQLDQRKTQLDERAKLFEVLKVDLQKSLQLVQQKQDEASKLLDALKKESAKYDAKIAKINADASQLKALEKNRKAYQVSVNADEEKGLKRLAEIYEKMEPKSAAQVIKTLADSGDTAVAVKIVSYMQARNVAPILEEIHDAPLQAQLMKRLITLKKDTKPGVHGN